MKVLLCGDISPTSDNNHLFAQVATETLFNDVKQLFDAADVSIVNLECALTEVQAPIAKIGPPIAASPNTAKVLKELGTTYCNLSNNHFYALYFSHLAPPPSKDHCLSKSRHNKQ